MVYGRILYNNIKEYTPKWYPTIPYSQTVKPTFSILYYLFQEDHLKLFLDSMLIQASKLDGDYLLEYSNITLGCGKFSSLVPLYLCILLSMHHFLLSTKLTIPTEHMKQQWSRKELIRKNLKNLNKLKEEANDLNKHSCNFIF